MKRYFLRSGAIFALFTSSIALIFSPVLALAEGAGGGLEISPTLVELSVKPGQSVNTTIRLRNVTKTHFVVTSHVNDFSAKGENGEPQILPDGQYAAAFSMSRWIEHPGDQLLEPNVYKSIPITINVPANAEPGGHYAVVRFSDDQQRSKTGKNGVSLTASVGSLILVKVSGKINESLKYISFQSGNRNSSNHFFEHGPISFTQRIENDGNVHEKPTGQVIILSSNSKKVASFPVNPKDGNVLPHSIRSFSETWKTNAIFGHYTATAHLAYAGGKTLESPVISFWIIPYHLIAYILLGVIVLYILIRLLARRYNVRITANRR